MRSRKIKYQKRPPMSISEVRRIVRELPSSERTIARDWLNHPGKASMEGPRGKRTRVPSRFMSKMKVLHSKGLNFRCLETLAGLAPANGMNAYRAVMTAKRIQPQMFNFAKTLQTLKRTQREQVKAIHALQRIAKAG